MASDSPTIRCRPARPHEHAALSALCLRSKAVRGYDAAFLDACRTALTITPSEIARDAVQVIDVCCRIAGVAHVVREGADARLDKLFVDPAAHGQGLGAHLYAWACAWARDSGAGALLIEADPGAAAFYRRMGALDDGIAISEVDANRRLPRFVVPLSGCVRSDS